MRESDEHSCIVFFDDDHHQLGLAPVLLLIELYLNDIALLARKFEFKLWICLQTCRSVV